MARNPTAIAPDGTSAAPSADGSRRSAFVIAGGSVAAIVVATGSGASMRSERPKPLQVLCGRPMLGHVLHAIAGAGASVASVVTGPDRDRVQKRSLEDPPTMPVVFSDCLVGVGSARAALVGLERLDEEGNDDDDILLIPADLPLLQASTISAFLEAHRRGGAACTVLGKRVEPGGVAQAATAVSPSFGGTTERFVRDRHGRIERLVPDDRLLGRDLEGLEAGLGIYCVRRELLAAVLRRSRPNPVDGSYPLYGMVEVLADSGHRVEVEILEIDLGDLRPVGSRSMLAEAEAKMRRRTNVGWMDRGVSMVDPERTYIDVTVRLGRDVTLFPGTILQGSTDVSAGCEVGPDTRLDCCDVGPDSVIEKTMARLSTIGQDCRVGPFAVLEQGSRLGDGTRTGPFYAAPAGKQS